MRSQAKATQLVPPGQESPVLEKQKLYQSSWKERRLQGARAGSQKGYRCPQAPRGTKRATALWGRSLHTLLAELPKGLDAAPSGAPGAAQVVATVRPRECDSSGADPRAQGTGDTAQDPALPPGQVEAGRTQGSKDAPAATRPRAVQIYAPCPRTTQAPADWELW